MTAENTSTTGWNFADVWEEIARSRPDADALIHDGEHRSWQEFDRRADGVGAALLDAGLGEQAKVALYLHNGPEYLESVFGAFKVGMVPVNTNYRYGTEEVRYLWDNADAEAVVFHGTFTERCEELRAELPSVDTWLWVDDGSGPCPPWAAPYESAATSGAGRAAGPWGRSGDHLLLLYTGGTTGMPKGVMWRQDDLLRGLLSPTRATSHLATSDPDPTLVAGWLPDPGPVGLPACPLMHGTGVFTQFVILSNGGAVATLTGRTFDVEELLDTAAAVRATTMAIVGDAFARPIATALEADPSRDLSSLRVITSSGVMFSEATKERITNLLPHVVIVDMFSSSEAMGMGRSVSSKERPTATARFRISERTRVVTDDGIDVRPGSGEVGRVAVGGFQPLGYYKDPEKSAATFLELDGKRYSVPGDYATVEADGTVVLLGRGSVCINTGGEKVFPEEVEEVLKSHPAIDDAVVVGVPDERFGERVVAVVEGAAGADVPEEEVRNFVKDRLAGYKAPRQLVSIETIGRSANGKVDYKRLRAHALDALGVGTPR